jgi:putative thiamine transport system permease protein
MKSASVLCLLLVSLLPTAAGISAVIATGFDAQALLRVLNTPGVGLSIASSVWTGTAATAISLLLAHLAVAAAATGRGGSKLNALVLPLLAMPHLAIGIGLVLVLAPSGLLLRLISPSLTGLVQPPDWFTVQDPFGLSLIAGLVIKETAFLILVLFAALAQIPSERLLLQAQTLGYGRLKSWSVAVAPRLQQQIRLPVAAVLVFGVTNVEMAIPLGPGLPPTFSVLLWRWFTDPDPLVHAQAYSGSLLLLAVALLALLVTAGAGRLLRLIWRQGAEQGARHRHDSRPRTLIYTLTGAVWLLGMLALVALCVRQGGGVWRFPDVLPTGASAAAGKLFLSSVEEAAGTTMLLGIATAVASVALVLPAAERLHADPVARQRVAVLLFLPLLFPQITLLFGYQVMLVALHADGTHFAVVWSHVLFALPYVWGVLAAARGALDPRYGSIARTLGKSASHRWLGVTGPLLLRAGLFAAAIAFSVSVALYLPTLFAGAGRIMTAATEAAAAAGSGTMRPASAHAVALAVLPLLAFAAAFGLRKLVFRNRRGVPA